MPHRETFRDSIRKLIDRFFSKVRLPIMLKKRRLKYQAAHIPTKEKCSYFAHGSQMRMPGRGSSSSTSSRTTVCGV